MIKYLFLVLLASLGLSHSSILQADFIEDKIRSVMEKKDVPGMSVVVIKNGVSRIYNFGVASRKTRKPVKDTTIFQLASITKVFTSTAVAVEVLDQHLNLNEPVVKYLPFFEGKEENDIRKVTLEELLTHTASLPREPPHLKGNRAYTKHLVLEYLKGWKAPYPIKSKYVYSNLSFGIAGYVLEASSRASLIEVYQRTILAPLGMHNTAIEIIPRMRPFLAEGMNGKGVTVPFAPPSAWEAGGALKSSPADMEKFLSANMDLKGPKKLIDAMKFAQEPRFTANKKLKMGLAWQNTVDNGLRRVDKNGGLDGSSSYIGFLPEKGIGVVILANRTKIDCTGIGRGFLTELARSLDKSEAPKANKNGKNLRSQP